MYAMIKMYTKKRKCFYLLEINGTTPKVSPQAAWTNTEKMSITVIDNGKEEIWPRIAHKTPPIVCTIHQAHNLPLIPNRLAIRSEKIPPPGLAKKLAKPKLAAIIPAV